eukprot:TRINITY_DN2318_c0_g1_i1.p1 TRINITY_DN2318_c0_g1~~TRINITY_DN2318_c0_g1_i1.p1  ORF type:complete len:1032 (-),score=466.14 TRINITY_DN2318_c0_g1_i1:446-3541(-)
MDRGKFLWALENGINPDPQARHESERILEEYACMPEYTLCAFDVATSGEVADDIRMMALTQLKSIVENHWRPVEYEGLKAVEVASCIPEAHKEQIRERLVQALVGAPPTLLMATAEVFRFVAIKDFPDPWSSVIEEVVSMIRSGEVPMMHGGLYALMLLMRKFQYVPANDERRGPLDRLTAMVMPLLVDVLAQAAESDEPVVAEMQKILFKCMYIWLQLGVPQPLREVEVLDAWMNAMLKVFTRPLDEPAEVAALEDAERCRYACWSARSRAVRVFSLMINRYGAPPSEDLIDFSRLFATRYSAAIANAALDVISRIRLGEGWLPSRVQQLTLSYLASSTRFSLTWREIQPHAHALCTDVVFPLLCFNQRDHARWVEDPGEYLRLEFDALEEYYSPRKTAESLIFDITRIRGKKYLVPFMNFLFEEVLAPYEAAPPEQRNYSHKDGALQAIGTLSSPLRRVSDYESELQGIMVRHVMPELRSPHGFLRARACFVLAQFWELEYEEGEHANAFANAMHAIFQNIADPELPVRVQACVSLRFLSQSDQAAPVILENMQPLLGHFFDIMNEIDSDDLVATLESLVSKFEDEMAPFAVEMCARLTENFLRMHEEEGDDEEDEGTALAALETMKTLQTVMGSVKDHKRVYPEIEEAVWPLLSVGIDEDFHEFFEEIIRVVSFLTYYLDSHSERMWSLFPRLCQAFTDGWAIDSLPSMIIPLDNFMSKDRDVFLSQSYMENVMGVVRAIIPDEHMPEKYLASGCQLIEVPILNFRGELDQYVPDLVRLMVERAGIDFSLNACKILFFDVFADLLYYNPSMTLSVIESTGHCGPLFQTWFSVLAKIKRAHDLKMHILGYGAILEVPSNELPPAVLSGLAMIVDAVISLAVRICELEVPSAAPPQVATVIGDSGDEDEEDEEDEEDDEEDPEEGIPTDEDVPCGLLDMDEGLLGFCEEELYDDELDDDDTFTTPLDSLDEIIYLFERFESINQREPELWASITGSLGGEAQEKVAWLEGKRAERIAEREKEERIKARLQ